MSRTIAAISTPPGVGGIAVVRLSGDTAIEICDQMFLGKIKIKDAKSHTVHYGKVIDSRGKVIDECLCTVMRKPNTYTKEDVVEFSVHGGSLAAGQTLSAALSFGAALATAGEFTKRAFLNGRIDLSQAEAVADIIDSKTSRALDVAVNQLGGALSEKIEDLRKQCLLLLSNLQAATDFPEETVDELFGTSVTDNLKDIEKSLDELIKGARCGEILQEGASVAIVGRPNTGKSSLLNAFLGKQRAIVTEIAGTTRDVIEEYVNIEGLPVRFLDTAGIRDAGDPVEQIGVEKAFDSIDSADLCLFVLDTSQDYTKEDAQIFERVKNKPYICIVNKSDLESALKLPEEIKAPVYMCAKNPGEDLADLKKEIFKRLSGSDVNNNTVMLTNIRHQHACESAREAVAHAIDTLSAGLFEDMAAIDLQQAVTSLGQITGMSVSDEVVSDIFERFCVGK